MANLHLPFYKGHIECNLPDEKIKAVLTSKAEEYKPTLSETEIVRRALENPVSKERLSELAKDKKHVVIISSDHTRPVPSHITMPLLLEEVRRFNKDVQITILIATGMHRATTYEELVAKYGQKIVDDLAAGI